MPKLVINGKEIEVEAGLTLIQACEIAGVEIPRFCYHDRLHVAGNCRMCLVEVEKSPKPMASCALPVAEGMVVHTDSPMVKRAREGVLEFLLINHPLDCPICDEAGECDLQDQTMKYARGNNRFDENKRSVEDKYMGPLIKTQMTRCIHCTRCVRFATDIAGVEELGAMGRGEHMEIGTYVEKSITSELSGNMIDICPVGALTSKPYAFKARSWELAKTESIDVLDAVGSNIRIDSRGKAVMRILPKLNEEINEEWISDKTRFAYDGLQNQRLDVPMIRVNGRLQPASWAEAMKSIKQNLKSLAGNEIAAIIGDLVDAESIMILKDIMTALKSPNMDCMQEGAKVDFANRTNYLFNTTIAGIEQSDYCILIGANPRHEATLINARIRKRSLRGNYPIYSVGECGDLTYPVTHLGDDAKILQEIASGKHSVVQGLKQSKKPMLIIGYGALMRNDYQEILHLCSEIVKKYNFVQDGWNGFNILHSAASRVAALDLGFVPQKDGMYTQEILTAAEKKKIKAVYLLGADEIDVKKLKDTFVIYQGHHGDKSAHIADVILPGAAYTEKDATYINLEGRVQRTHLAVSPCGESKEDWLILKMVAEELKIELKYNNKEELYKKMIKIAPAFATYDIITQEKWHGCGVKGELNKQPIQIRDVNYYFSDPICRASKTMAQCVAEIWNGNKVA
jgi:NADH-quinone oxidoreductase subunit G